MLAQSIMLNDFPSVNFKDSTELLSELSFEYDIYHIPVTEKGKLLGVLPFDIVGELDILEDKQIGSFKRDLLNVFIKKTDYIFNAFQQIVDYELTAIPVVDNEMNVCGIIRNLEIITYFQKTLSIREPGSFITLEVNSRDYNLQEIARIVESNNAKILSLHIDGSTQGDVLLVSIKINRRIITHVLATFDRFGYNYIAHSGDEEKSEDLMDRYNLLMKMLNV